jgi:DNA primase
MTLPCLNRKKPIPENLIPKDKVDEILETARVEEVVGEFVNLKKRGANLLGLCPFHNEKTPSFTVSPAKGIYKCFGCGQAGGAVNFIMEHEQQTYPEALRYLAEKYNIEIEEEELSAEQIKATNEKESLMIISKFARDYFREQLLQTEEGKNIGLSYFRERGFREKTIEEFELGYAPEEREAFTKAALDKGYELKLLEKTGLTIVKYKDEEQGEVDRYFDRFAGRVIFPIHNVSGRPIAFGGRTLSADKKTAKYLNSPESDIYHKSKVLYGLHFAKRAISSQDLCYLVEGYTDVISLHQNGIENVVSSSGTSLTTEQIRLIKRYTSNITVLYDGDSAGIKAALRGTDLILEEGMNVKVVLFTEGDDPDTFARNHSSAELKEFLEEQAVDFIRFKSRLLLEESGKDPIKRASLVKDIIHSISLIPDPITRSVYIQECSQLLDIQEATLMAELNKIRRKRLGKQIQRREIGEEISEEQLYIPEKEKPLDEDQLIYQEEDLIRTLIKYGDRLIKVPVHTEEEEEETEVEIRLASYVVEEIMHDQLEFTQSLMAKIYQFFAQAESEKRPLKEGELVSNEDKEVSSFAIDALMDKYQLSINWEEKHRIIVITEEEQLPKKVHKGLCSWRLKKVADMLKKKQQLLKENPDDYQTVLKEIHALIQAKKALADELGRIILA